MATPDKLESDAAAKVAAAKARLAKTRALKAQGVVFKVLPSESMIRAFDSRGGELGSIKLGPANKHGDREIKNIYVAPEARGKGIAGGLFTEAQRQGMNPIHSVDRSPNGDAFARSTGTYVPPLADYDEMGRIQRGSSKYYPQIKAQNKAQGKALAKQKAIEARLGKLAGPTSGTMGVLSFLPMLMQAGQVATGRDQELQRQLAVLRQPQ